MRERIIRAVAGGLVLISLVLGYFVDPAWFLIAVFVGFNLFQSSFTKICPLEMILKSAGVKDTK